MTEQNEMPEEQRNPDLTQLEEFFEVEMSPGEGWAVILYDDPYHLRDHVVLQLVKALGCSAGLADGIVDRIENHGKGVVIISNHAEAKRVQLILREIRLKTEMRRIG